MESHKWYPLAFYNTEFCGLRSELLQIET